MIGMAYSDLLRDAITRSALSHRELARRAGCHAMSIHRFVAKQTSLYLSTADRLAAVLGVELPAVGLAAPAAVSPAPKTPAPKTPDATPHPRPAGCGPVCDQPPDWLPPWSICPNCGQPGSHHAD